MFDKGSSLAALESSLIKGGEKIKSGVEKYHRAPATTVCQVSWNWTN